MASSGFGLAFVAYPTAISQLPVLQPLFGVFCIVGFLLGLFLSTQGGFHWLDIIDHWAGQYGLAVVGLSECLVIGYFIDTRKFLRGINQVSEIKVGEWWIYAVRYITSLILGISLILDIIQQFSETYGGYPLWSVITGGWLQVALLIAFSIILMQIKWKK